MIKGNNNPWEPMNIGSSRRINSEIPHDVFWIKDEQGNYGFFLQSAEKFKSPETDIRLKGVTLIKRNTISCGELFLILNKRSDWELFLSLCKDILSVCIAYSSNSKMVHAVEARLKRWQVFLMQNNDPFMSVELQMGLFTELTCLRNLMPIYGVKDSIIAWCGPERDRKDFNFPNVMFEVKSFKTSKGPEIIISSAHQLLKGSKPLYIVSYGLTPSEKGSSVKNIVSELDNLLKDESLLTRQLFENKVISYGYMPDMNDNTLIKFTIDNLRVFEITDDFPRLVPQHVPSEIIKLNYTLDLELCKKHERLTSAIFKEHPKRL
ncbi:PD-(D/E)XK motif protein [Parapedobacter deserti]|uniref:PD-(D/E)XK motif protein n=1 Tax=Parapedobacter deserti TaxID=1912957 RepID=A0ABV7JXB2_9SPHI